MAEAGFNVFFESLRIYSVIHAVSNLFNTEGRYIATIEKHYLLSVSNFFAFREPLHEIR